MRPESERETNYRPGMTKHKFMQRTRVLSFTSGKGGVGKTHTVANLGVALAERGKSVLLLDADLGLANLDLLLNLKPKRNLNDVLKGNSTLDDIALTGPGGVSVLPAASGVEELSQLSAADRMMLLETIEAYASKFDYLLIDTPAGIGSDVMFFNSAAENVVIVVTNEPTSITDAYALMKVMSNSYREKKFWIVVNKAADARCAKNTFKTLSAAVEKHLRVGIKFLAWLPEDKIVRECIIAQRPLVQEWPSSECGRAFFRLADELDNSRDLTNPKAGMQFFFRDLLEGAAHGS